MSDNLSNIDEIPNANLSSIDEIPSAGELKKKVPSQSSVTAPESSTLESGSGVLGGIEQIAPPRQDYVTLSGQKKPLDALNSVAFTQPKELLEEDFTISKRKAKEREPLKQAYIKVQQTPDRNN